jgi:hypothetical protein
MSLEVRKCNNLSDKTSRAFFVLLFGGERQTLWLSMFNL